MNICYLCRTFHRSRGGVETTYYLLAKHLAARGHTVHIITLKGQERFYLQDLGKRVFIHKIDFTERPFPGYWHIDHILPLTNFRYAKAVSQKLKEITRTYPIDIVVTPDGFGEAIFVLWEKKFPVHLRLHGHKGLLQRYHTQNLYRGMRDRVLWLSEWYILKNAHGITAVSSEFADLVKKVWRFKDLDVSIVHSGVDQTVFNSDQQINVRKDVFFVGRLEENKGIGILIQAIPVILKAFPTLKFCFAGADGPCGTGGGNWREFILSKIPKENVLFLGQIPTEELIQYYQKSAVTVFPSLYEAGGNAALESMACGCPTVASNLGGFAEFICSREDGILIPPQDVERLVQSVCEILTNPHLAGKLSQNSVAKVTNHFNIEKICDKTIEAYQSTINNFNCRQRVQRKV